MENTTYRKARGRICVTSEEAKAEGYVKRNKITEDDLKPDRPKIFFKNLFVNTVTGEKSADVLAQAKLSE